MELRDLLRSTGAIRHYTDEPLSDELIWQILDDARFAPSGGNRQAWRVVVVQDERQRRALGELYLDVWPEYLAMREAGLRPYAPTNDPAEEQAAIEAAHGPAAPVPGEFATHFAEVPAMLAVLIDISEIAALDKDADHYPVVGGASIYPFVHNILLCARDHGVGGVMTTQLARKEREVLEILGAPATMALAAVVTLGFPAEGFPHPRRREVAEFATFDRLDGVALTGPE